MKKLPLLVLIPFLLTALLRAETFSGAHPYLQASLIHVDLGGEVEKSIGSAVAVGLSFKNSHAIEIEMINFNTTHKYDFSYAYDTGEYDFRHVLLTYRYAFTITPGLKLFIAGSGGIANVKHDRTYYAGGTAYRHLKGSSNAEAVGAQFGALYEFSPHWTITAAGRLLAQGSTEELSGAVLRIFQAGLRYTF